MFLIDGYMKRFLMLALMLAMCVPDVYAAWADNYKYSFYGIKEGLCDEYVISTYLDSSGYLWISTSNGLDRFDGNRFIHFNSHSEDEVTRINNDFVYNVAEDRYHHIWGVTNTGLFRIDVMSGRISFPEEFPEWKDVLSAPMNGILSDDEGNLWIMRSDGFIHLILDDVGEIADVVEVDSESRTVRYMVVQDDIVWLAGLSGIECYRKGSGNEITSLSLGSHPDLLEISDISSLLAQGDYLWIGTERGLFCYNVIDKVMRTWIHDPQDTDSLSDDHVTCLAADRSGDLIIGTVKGIDHMSRDGHFQHMVPGQRGRSINAEYINHILIGDDGTMWVSTLMSGVNQVSPSHVRFEDRLVVTDGVANIVSCVYEDRSGNLLAGVLGKGLAIERAGTDEVEIVSLKESGISQEDIFCIVQDNEGDYWMASRNDGLIHLRHEDLGKSRFRSHSIVDDEGNAIKVIYDIEFDQERNGLWISTVEQLFFMNLSTDEMNEIHLKVYNSVPLRLHNILLDSRDRLLIGGYGLNIIDVSRYDGVEDSLTVIYNPSMDPSARRGSDRVTSVTESVDGTIFVGTQSNGVYSYNDDGTFTPIRISNQEFRQRISKLLTDAHGSLWASTADGVFHYNPRSQRLTQFGSKDGILSTNCYINSGNILADGRVAFGTANGMLVFDTPFRPISTVNRSVAFTGIKKNEKLSLSRTVTEIDMYPSDTSLEIQFSSLDLPESKGITYSYRIDGEDESWNITPQGSVRYSNLKPGQYVFRVRSTNSDNSWSSLENTLDITVHPPIYQTFWFWLLIVAVIFSYIVYMSQRKIVAQRRNQQYLADQVKEKTASLTKAMQDILESKESIERQNLLLEEQKAKLEDYSQQMEKANREKLMLYTNLTHEFKTPLTLILGPVSELAASNKDAATASALSIIERNSKYLLSLVNQVLDLRRVEAGQVKIRKEEFSIARLADIYTLDYGSILKERNVTFEIRTRLIHRHIWSDRDVIHKILSNLMSNAVKHTPAGGRIVLRMMQFVSRKDGKVMQYLSVTNSGSFISRSEYERIYERFYKIENQPVQNTGLSNSGIGLYLVRQLVNDLSGEIRLKSTPKTGTSFRILFPVELVEREKVAEEQTYIPPENPETPVLLLVEDNVDMRAYIRSILEDKFHVAEASDGETGYDMAKKIMPDFIISDMMMPGMNGLELCRKVREDGSLSHIPFLMLTALSNDAIRMESYKEGVDAFLVKPFKKEMLLTRIESIISNYQRKQSELTFDLKSAYAQVDIERTDKMFLENLLSILKDNYTNPEFNVPQLQSQMCMSMTSFYKKVTALTGLTPALFIRLYRLQTARKLLEQYSGDNGMSVSEVAYSVGFNDPKYFSKCFFNQYGVLPSAVLQGEQIK